MLAWWSNSVATRMGAMQLERQCVCVLTGVIAVDLARQMLQLYPNTYALVLSTENLTFNW
jgi:hypothetical protein